MAQVDGTKGCYVGQEVVARLDTYSKVQRALVRVHARGLATGMRLAPRDRGRPGVITTAPAGCSVDPSGLADAALGYAALPVDVGDELRVLDRAGAQVGVAEVSWRAISG
jgi:folate-binding Fe-S cluster repair protein YgfZ